MTVQQHTADLLRTLLEEVKGRESLRSIASGAGVPYSWLVRFARGDFYDAASRRVEDVYRYLQAKRTLEKTVGGKLGLKELLALHK